MRSAYNDAGQAAFSARVDTGGGRPLEITDIFRGDGVTLTNIASQGQNAPDDNGVFHNFFDPVLNDVGQTAFAAELTGTSGGADRGIFRGDSAGVTQIVRAGQIAPDGNGSFNGTHSPAINNSGQVAFESSLAGTNGGTFDDFGLFRFDDLRGLVQVAREGDSFLGSTIAGLTLGASIVNGRSGRTGLMNGGKLPTSLGSPTDVTASP